MCYSLENAEGFADLVEGDVAAVVFVHFAKFAGGIFWGELDADEAAKFDHFCDVESAVVVSVDCVEDEAVEIGGFDGGAVAGGDVLHEFVEGELAIAVAVEDFEDGVEELGAEVILGHEAVHFVIGKVAIVVGIDGLEGLANCLFLLLGELVSLNHRL